MAEQDFPVGGSRRHGRLGSVVRISTALALGVLSLPLVAAPASAAPVLDAIDGTPPTTITPEPDATGAGDDIFQASKENQSPSTWRGFIGKVDTGSDISDVYTEHAIDPSNGDLWFYLGYARTEAGVATGVVELNQLADVNGAGGGIKVPQREDGDVRITFTQENGGAPFTEYAVQRWTGNTWATPVTLNPAEYQSASSDDGLFAEFAIDLSATGLAPACDTAFTEVNLRTRSSDKDSAELKDYVSPIPVTVQARCRKITVQKYDDKNQPLSGAQFQLYADSNGNGGLDLTGSNPDTALGNPVMADQGTDTNSYTWSDLPWGTYFVKETARPIGYQQDPVNGDVQKIVLDANTPNNGTAYVQFDNPQTMAAIEVQKYDSVTHRSLPGAQFQLYADSDQNGSLSVGDEALGDPVTANRGDANRGTGNAYTWDDLRYGTYFVQETKAPDGYEADPTDVRTVTLAPADAGTTKTVRFADTPLTPTIVVTKHDADGNPVTGAGFTLYADTNHNGSYDADADKPVGGQVWADQGGDRNSYTWDTGLDWGTYFVKETTTPAGYGTDPTATGGVKKVDLPNTTPDGVATVDFADPRLTASITVRKFDFKNHDPLQGATFALYTDDNGDGTFDSGDKPAGLTQPADGGPNDNTATWTDLAWGKDYLVVETVSPPGYDADETAVNGGKLVSLTKADAGTTTTVDFVDPRTKSPNGTITVHKTDASTGNAVDGAMFGLYVDDNGDGKPEPGELRYSDPPRTAVGTYQWQVPAGTYLVEEQTAPAGYVLPAQPVQTVTVGAGDNQTVEFADSQKPSTIEVTKTDAVTGDPLEGATFTLTGPDGKPTPPTTAADGSYTWSGLRMGDYTITETAPPPGYTLPAQPSKHVTIDADNAGSTLHLAFADSQKTSTIVVHKYDADTLAQVDGATFTLTKDGAPVPTKPAHTSGTGTYTWTDLPMGDYTVTETAPPPGYLPATTSSSGASQDALFNTDTAGSTAVLDFYDQRRTSPPPPPGAAGTDLVVTKRDQVTGAPLDTATFQLYDDDGDGVFTSADQVHGKPQQTVDGQVRWADLAPGTYFVQEVSAPRGYQVRDAETVVVDPSQAGTTIRRDLLDPRLPTTLQVLKADDVTNQPLAGATFRLYQDSNANGTVDSGDRPVGKAQVSDDRGLADWSGLGFGSYLLEEVSAPDGYDLPAHATQRVTVDRDNAGGVLQVVFLDPARTGFAISKVAMERSDTGQWLPSDGTVGFGDPLRYVITVAASGPRTEHSVHVSDYVPGYAPGSVDTTARASYVAGSATCLRTSCTASYDAATGRVSWDLGDLAGGTSRKVAFVVRMPRLPAHPVYVDGVYTETVVNVADVSWQEPTATTARAAGYQTRSLRSNEVRTSVVDAPEVLHIPSAHRPHAGGPGTGGLPNTGAPAHLGGIGVVGWLSVLCGGWLMLRRRNAHPPAGR